MLSTIQKVPTSNPNLFLLCACLTPCNRILRRHLFVWLSRKFKQMHAYDDYFDSSTC